MCIKADPTTTHSRDNDHSRSLTDLKRLTSMTCQRSESTDRKNKLYNQRKRERERCLTCLASEGIPLQNDPKTDRSTRSLLHFPPRFQRDSCCLHGQRLPTVNLVVIGSFIQVRAWPCDILLVEGCYAALQVCLKLYDVCTLIRALSGLRWLTLLSLSLGLVCAAVIARRLERWRYVTRS